MKLDQTAEQMADELLVARAQEGDREAFDLLFKRQRPRALRMARSMLRDDELSLDVVQEAMIQAYLCVGSLRENGSFGSWLLGIVRNLCNSHLRSQRHSPVSLEVLAECLWQEEDPFTSADPGETLLHREQARVVQEAVERLPAGQKKAMKLFYFEGLNLQEVAAAIGISVAAVKGSLHKGRKRLRQELVTLFPEAPPPIPQKRRSKMELTLAGIVAEYQRQSKIDPSQADPLLLDRGKALLEGLPPNQDLDSQFVHAGLDLCGLLHDHSSAARLVSRWLQQPLPTGEEAWARREQALHLSMSGQHQEAVKAQERLYEWAREHLPGDRLFWVMSNGEGALSWMQLEKEEEWLQKAAQVLERVPATAENRMDRFLLLRVMVLIEARTARVGDGLIHAQQIALLAEEAPAWEMAFRMGIEGRIAALMVHERAGHIPQVRLLGQEIRTLLEEQLQAPELTAKERRQLSTLFHNTAAPLYGAHQYDLSIPLFQHAVELGSRSPHTYFWLAASMWAATKDRARTISVLQRLSQLDRGENLWSRLASSSEFAEVAEDPEFQQAAA